MHSKKELINQFNTVLAETYALYIKTQSYHWNITGASFYFLHRMLEDQYNDLANAIDIIAERIRMLDYKVQASFMLFNNKKSANDPINSNESKILVADLVKNELIIIKELNLLASISSANEDRASEDIAIQRLYSHEKHKWILQSSI